MGPEETLTERGNWIAINKFLAVITRKNEVWSYDGSDSRVYAIGDCNAACVGQRDSGEKDAKGRPILIVGMGFIGVEWATEIKHFFPKISITMCDMAPNCLGPLPKSAASYCEKYLERNNINFYYETGYAPKDEGFWKKIQLPNKADYEYICVGVKASNTFMPEDTLTERGNWIAINKFLAVITRNNEVWSYDGSDSRVYAIGDCNAACVGQRDSGEKDAKGRTIFA